MLAAEVHVARRQASLILLMHPVCGSFVTFESRLHVSRRAAPKDRFARWNPELTNLPTEEHLDRLN